MLENTPSPPPVPQEGCDTHMHVFEHAPQYPMVADRVYTPGTASWSEYQAICKKFGISRTILVQPSVYGTDNSLHLHHLQRYHETTRMVVVCSLEQLEKHADDWHHKGVRGVRINLATSQDRHANEEENIRLMTMLNGLGWHAQIFASTKDILTFADQTEASHTAIVADHFAGFRPDLPMQQNDWDRIICLLQTERLFIKLTSRIPTVPHYQLEAFLKRFQELCHRFPRQMLWGSDWPHTNSLQRGKNPTQAHQQEGFRDVDWMLEWKRLWALCGFDKTIWQLVLRDNPASLYDF